MATRNITIRVSTTTHAALKEAAREKSTTISDLGRKYIEAAVERRAWEDGVGPVLPDIRFEIQSKLVKMEERFARLLGRTAIESGATKRLVLRVLTEIRTAEADDIVRWEAETWQASSKSLYQPLKELNELMETLRVSPEKGKEPEN